MQRARFLHSQSSSRQLVARWVLVIVVAMSSLTSLSVHHAAAAPAHTMHPFADLKVQSASTEVDLRSSHVEVTGPHHADGSAAATITVTLRDDTGHPVPGKQILVTSSGIQNTLTGPLNVTDATGVTTATITSTMPEAKSIQALVVESTGAIALPQTPLIEFTGAEISGAVFLDDDGDAQVDDDEQRLPGVVIRLYVAGEPTPIQQIATTGDGYRFSGLLPGNYQVVAVPLAGYSASGAQETTVTIEAFGISDQHSFGRTPSALMHGRIWTDGNQNGQQDVGEEGIANASMTITGPTGATKTITSAVSGHYQTTVPAPMAFAPANQSFTAGGYVLQEPLMARVDNAGFDRLGTGLAATNYPENFSFATRGYSLDAANLPPNDSFSQLGYPLDPATYPNNASFNTSGYALDSATYPVNANFEAGTLASWEGIHFQATRDSRDGSWAAYRPMWTTGDLVSSAFVISSTAQSLKWWWRSRYGGGTRFDLMDAASGDVLVTMYDNTGTNDAWLQFNYNVTPYVGKTVRFRMSNGYADQYLFLDDLMLTVDVPGWTIEGQPNATQSFYISSESYPGGGQSLHRPLWTTEGVTSPAFSIPTTAQSLKWWWRSRFGGGTRFDLLDAASDTVLVTMYENTGTNDAWLQFNYNVTPYVGKSVRFRMSNGNADQYLFLDDLQFTVDVPGWTIDGQPNSTQAFYISSESHVGGGQSLHRPLWTTEGVTSPAFTIPATAQSLKWWWRSRYGGGTRFDLLDATSGDVLATMYGDTGTNDAWLQFSYNVTSYVGKTVRFRMSNGSADQYLFLDDLQFTVDVPGWTIDGQPNSTQAFYISSESHAGGGQSLHRPLWTTEGVTSPAFTIPATAQSLKWWWRSRYGGGTRFDLLDAASDTVLVTMYENTGTNDAWYQFNYNVTPYVGKSVRFRMSNGNADQYLFLDDLQFTVDVPGWTIDGQPNSTQAFYISSESHAGGSQSLHRPLWTTEGVTSPAFTIPATAQSLKWWWRSRYGGGTRFDLLDATSGDVLATMYGDTGTNDAWLQFSYNVTPYVGKTVRFRMSNGYADQYLFLDDLTLTVDVPGWTIEGMANGTQSIGITMDSHDGTPALYRPLWTTEGVTSPAFSIPATAQSLKWWWRSRFGGGTRFDLLDAASGSVLVTMYGDTGTNDAWRQFSYNVTPYVGKAVRFRMSNGNADQYLLLDDVVIDPSPTAAYNITALSPANYAATTPDRVKRDLSDGQDIAVDFGAYPTNRYQAIVTVAPDHVAADGFSPALVTVKLRDITGAPLPNRAVDLITMGHALTLTQMLTQTNAVGVMTGTIQTDQPQTVHVTARTRSDNVVLSNPVSVAFVADARPDLTVTLRGTTETPQGGAATYRITIRNNGGATARDVVVVQRLPEGVMFLAQTGPVDIVQDGTTLTWRVREVPPAGELRFTATAQAPNSIPVATSLATTVQVTSSSPDTDTTNNVATFATVIVPAYAFTAALSAAALDVYADTAVTTTLRLTNNGWLADTYTLTASGAAASWMTLPDAPIGLPPGGMTEVPVVIHPPATCQAVTQIPLQLAIHAQGSNIVQSVTATLNLVQVPTIMIDAPQDASTIGSRTALFTWRTSSASTGALMLTSDGQPEHAQTFATPNGTVHTVRVDNLNRGTTYTWQVTATGTCGTATSPVQRLTIGNGIVFTQHQQAYTVQRDYNQLVAVEVQNQDTISHTLTVAIGHPYADIIVNFVGSGSVDETITLLPGERRTVQLAIHTQDAAQSTYTLTGHLTSDEGTNRPIIDATTIQVAVLAAGDFTLEEVGLDSQTGVRTYTVTNHGLPITDLGIEAHNPQNGQPARVYLTPDVHHARIGTGETITFKAIPLFGPEDTAPSVAAGGAIIPDYADPPTPPSTSSPVTVQGTGGGQTKTLDTQAGCAPGKRPFAVHRQNVIMRFPTTSWYCTNRPAITMPINLPSFINPDSVDRMTLRMTFSPQSDVRSHTTSLSFNGTTIGNASGIPNGTYEWAVDPQLLNGGPHGVPVQQQIALNSTHMNGGHYVVSTGVELGVSLDDVTVYVCAESQEEAEQIADELYGFTPAPTHVSAVILSPTASSTFDMAQNVAIPLEVIVQDDLPTYENIYRVTAQLAYLDAPAIPAETVTLFDAATNGHFRANWTPKAAGQVAMHVTAQSINGLTATAQSSFMVRAVPDLVALNGGLVWTWIVGPTNSHTYLDVRNDGAPISQDVQVDFRYYKVNLDTRQPEGEPVHISAHIIPKNWFSDWQRGEVRRIEDGDFHPSENGLYYVEIVIDPPETPAQPHA